jgi:outer membrane protein TolC
MKTTKLLTGFLTGLVMLQIDAQDIPLELSLDQVRHLAMENNVTIRNAGLSLDKSYYQRRELQGNLYPKIDGFSTFSYYYAIPKMIVPGEIFGQPGMIPVQIGTTYDWSTGFRASQVLYNKSYYTSLKLARQMELLAGLSLQQQKEAIAYQVSQIYFLCKNTEKQIEMLTLNLQRHEKLADITWQQSNQGIVLKIDHSRVLVYINNICTQIENLELLYQHQTGWLKYLSGIDLSRKLILTDSLRPEILTSSALPPDYSNHSAIRYLDKQIEITRLSKASQSQEILPSLSGFAQFYYQGQQNEFDFLRRMNQKFFRVGYLGISLNVSLFNGFSHQARLRQNDLDLQQLQNTRADTWNGLAKAYEEALSQYKNSISAIERQINNIRVAEEVVSASLLGYEQQVTSLSDVILAEASLTEARLSYYNALLMLRNAELDLEKAKGEILDF